MNKLGLSGLVAESSPFVQVFLEEAQEGEEGERTDPCSKRGAFQTQPKIFLNEQTIRT